MDDTLLTRTCIACPRGCRLELQRRGQEVMVSGHSCPTGEEYGVQEATAPRRVLTTTVRTTFPHLPRLPVRSSAEVLLSDIPRLMRLIDGLCVDRAVGCGDVVLRDLCPSGVHLISTDEVEHA